MPQVNDSDIINHIENERKAWRDDKITDTEYVSRVFWYIARSYGLRPAVDPRDPPPGPCERADKA